MRLKRYFNSIKVRLKLNNPSAYNIDSLLFQFHKGTIKTQRHEIKQMQQSDFNSIKVRLKLSVEPIYNGKRKVFQFHKGTIKTPLSLRYTKPEDFIGLRVQKYKKNFRKMSMPKDIFSAALRQPAYLWRFQ